MNSFQESNERLCRSLINEKIYKDPRLLTALADLRFWMGQGRAERPTGYLNQIKYFQAYIAYYLPLHLPELFWILDQVKARGVDFEAKTLLDVGCGPGTLSLSYFLWAHTHKKVVPESFELWDQAGNGLDYAKEKLKLLAPEAKLYSKKLRLPNSEVQKNDHKVDLILVGHFLNEWGSGPRFREQKHKFLKKLMIDKLTDKGLMVIVEPPLREPTIDLMALRDELIHDFHVVAPCPQSSQICPLLKDKVGWCYSQPFRMEFQKLGIAPFDKKLEKILKIQITNPGFSYLVLSKEEFILKNKFKIAVTDKAAPRPLVCAEDGRIVNAKKPNSFRGAPIE